MAPNRHESSVLNPHTEIFIANLVIVGSAFDPEDLVVVLPLALLLLELQTGPSGLDYGAAPPPQPQQR